MTETHIAHVNGSHRCYVATNGINRQFVGCHHATPREAIAHTVGAGRRGPAAVRRWPGVRVCCGPLSLSVACLGDVSQLAADRDVGTSLVPPGPVGAPSPERVP